MQELSEVSEAARDLEMSRFRLIQPYIEQKRSLESTAALSPDAYTVPNWLPDDNDLATAVILH
jgi:hypothetical protein